MHAENFSACACIFACCAGEAVFPAGANFWQARWADWNWGELGSIPLLGPIEIPPLVGSGKFGTP